MRNILITVLLFLLLYNTVTAQLFSREKILNQENFDKAFLSWGYFLGFNSYDFNFDYNKDLTDIRVKKNTGLNVGLVGNMRIK